MRWMEALVERAGSAADPPAEPKPWRSRRPEPRVRRAGPPPPRFARLTRALNFVLALLALVIIMPVLLLIALAVKLTSRGPVLYTQERVGLDRRNGGRDGPHPLRRRDLGRQPFTIYKF